MSVTVCIIYFLYDMYTFFRCLAQYVYDIYKSYSIITHAVTMVAVTTAAVSCHRGWQGGRAPQFVESGHRLSIPKVGGGGGALANDAVLDVAVLGAIATAQVSPSVREGLVGYLVPLFLAWQHVIYRVIHVRIYM